MTTPAPQEPDGSAPLRSARGGNGDFAVLGALLPYLRPYLGRIVLSLGLILVSKVATLLVPLALKQIVDRLNLERSLLVLPVALLLAYGASRIGVTLFTELRQVVFARVMARTSRQITVKVFRHLHDLSLKFHLDRRTGGVSRDVERGSTAVSDLLDWTLYTIVPTAVEADTRANERAVDSLLNYETVKYFNNEAHETARYDESLRRLEDANVLAQKTLALLNSGQTVIVAIGVTAMMWRAAAGVVGGRLTVGDLVLVNAYLLQLSSPLFFLGMMYREVKQSLTNMERLFGLLDQPADVQDRPGAVPLVTHRPHVTFEGVRFGYDARREILHGVDFEIPPGGTVAVVGHSGSGKSTLARLMYRFYDVDDGHIRVDGQDLRDVTQKTLRAAIGIVPQDTVLFNDTILYNIHYGRPEAGREEVEAAARAAHIHAFIVTLPDGYETQVGERGLKLSGGEKQRVAIARALLKNPAILIFDEATSALDSQSEKAIQAELDRIQVGRTTLVIAHRLSTVMGADQILVMDGGRIVERGTHDELLAAGRHYARMWRLQQQERAEEVSSQARV